ncbi:TPA: plasmid mobilization relaxosome protein MobC [Streptococcus suis]|nr:plasmid mobilization relaxosome protein MobC [Streptococcus suis]
MSKRFRGILKNFYVTQEENQLLNHRVKMSRHKDFSSYARHILLHPRKKEILVDTSGLQDLVVQIRRIGNNINQITKVAHQTGDVTMEQVMEVENQVLELDRLIQAELKLPASQLLKKYGGREE